MLSHSGTPDFSVGGDRWSERWSNVLRSKISQAVAMKRGLGAPYQKVSKSPTFDNTDFKLLVK